MAQTIQNIVLINNSKTAWPTQISMPFFFKNHDGFGIVNKIYLSINFGLRCTSPLTPFMSNQRTLHIKTSRHSLFHFYTVFSGEQPKSKQVLIWTMLLPQTDTKNSNFEIFESTLCMKSGSMPLTIKNVILHAKRTIPVICSLLSNFTGFKPCVAFSQHLQPFDMTIYLFSYVQPKSQDLTIRPCSLNIA